MLIVVGHPFICYFLATGMFNLVVWGRLNWFSQDEFLKENVIHVVLSKTLG